MKAETQESAQNTTDYAENAPEGDIKINHTVIGSIVRLSALEVSGVASVGGRFMDGVAEIFSKKESERGVTVREDESGRYIIDVRVILYFGNPLTQVAIQIQQNVAQQVTFMTHKEVAQVNVIIDGVKDRENESKTED